MRKLLTIIFQLCCLSMWAGDEVHLVWSPKGVKMSPKQVAGLTLTCDGGHALIAYTDTTRELKLVLSGTSKDGRLTVKSHGRVSITLDKLSLQTTEGSALNLKCGKRVDIHLKKGTDNLLEDGPDTLHKAVLQSKGSIHISGAGSLKLLAHGGNGISTKKNCTLGKSLGHLTIEALGTGCKGVRCGRDFVQHGGNVNIVTKGSYLCEDTTMHFPPMFGDGEMPEDFQFPEGFNPDSMMMGPHPGGPHGPGMGPDGQPGMSQGQRPDFGHGGQPDMPQGQHPDFGPDGHPGDPRQMEGMGNPMQHPGMPFPGGMPEGGDFQFPEGFNPDSMMMGGPMPGPMRPRYIGTTKAVKAMGSIIVEGGSLSVTTSSPGAEGLEGKKGVTLSGGVVNVNAYDDAINSNGRIVFSGATVKAVSTNNDAVDSNGWTDGAITISGGHVEVYSAVGPPEEGFDCDESPIVITGGEAISVGSGMGPWPSMPNETSAKQLFFLAQNLNIQAGDTLTLCTSDGKVLMSVVSPVSNGMDESLITHPALQKGQTYLLKQNDKIIKEIQL